MILKVLILGTMECCLFSSFLFSNVLPKRQHFLLRVGIMSFLEMVFAFLALLLRNEISFFLKSREISTMLSIGISLNAVTELIVYLLLLTLFFLVCNRIKFQNALYCSVCAYLTQDLAYTLFAFILPAASHRGSRSLNPETIWIEILILLLCNAAVYRLLIRPVISRLEQLVEIRYPLMYMIFVLLIGRVLGTLSSIHLTTSGTVFFRISLLYDMLLAFSSLAAQILIFKQGQYRQRLMLERNLRLLEYRNFDAYRNSVQTLRKRTHDMKHIIAALQQDQKSGKQKKLLGELQNTIHRYDASANTGNASLDTLLTHTCEQCQQNEILWTCMADGKSLEFMDPFDLYIMLGNALDNAIECLSQVPDKEKRFLSINIRRKNSLILFSIRNYCQQMPKIIHGLPVTTKEEKLEHGYGMKSIQEITQKYNGQLQVRFENNTFILNILLPSPESFSSL